MPRPGLEPGPFDPESNALTIRPPRLPICLPSDLQNIYNVKYNVIEHETSPLIRSSWRRFTYLGCILLGLFWLFLFRLRNNRIHGVSISKRTLLHVSDQPEASRDRRGRPRRISRQKCPKRRRILSIPSKPHSVHSAIGGRMNGMPDIPFIPKTE